MCGQRKPSNDPHNNQHDPQYANYWAPVTRTRHIPPHPARPQHTNYWAPRTRKRHQQEHRPQRPTERSDPTQHAKGRTGDCRGPRKGTATRRNVTQPPPPPPDVRTLRQQTPRVYPAAEGPVTPGFLCEDGVEAMAMQRLSASGPGRASRSTCQTHAVVWSEPNVPLASAGSDVIGWSRVLLSHAPDAARSY